MRPPLCRGFQTRYPAPFSLRQEGQQGSPSGGLDCGAAPPPGAGGGRRWPVHASAAMARERPHGCASGRLGRGPPAFPQRLGSTRAAPVVVALEGIACACRRLTNTCRMTGQQGAWSIAGKPEPGQLRPLALRPRRSSAGVDHVRTERRRRTGRRPRPLRAEGPVGRISRHFCPIAAEGARKLRLPTPRSCPKLPAAATGIGLQLAAGPSKPVQSLLKRITLYLRPSHARPVPPRTQPGFWARGAGAMDIPVPSDLVPFRGLLEVISKRISEAIHRGRPAGPAGLARAATFRRRSDRFRPREAESQPPPNVLPPPPSAAIRPSAAAAL